MFRATAIALAACLACAAFAGTAVATESAVTAPNPATSAVSAASSPADQSASAAPNTAEQSASEEPRIVAVYPNPVTHGDAGEYVELWLPPDREPLALTDGRTTVELPANVSGRVVVTGEPDEVHVDGEPRVVTAPGLTLANGGGQLRLVGSEGAIRHAAAYDRAPEGEEWNTATASWRPLGYDPREPRTYEGGNTTLFTLPDSPAIPRSTLRNADDRILLAGYTLTSEEIVQTLLAADERGVTVRVLLERSPVGGVTRRQAAALDRLANAGVDVRVLGGPRSRFAYHHAKYAVADDDSLVLTENWKPAGTGGRGSRGWGVKSTDANLAAGLATLFERDADGLDATPWSRYRRGRTFPAETNAASGEYSQGIAPESVRPRRVRLLTAPGNAEREMVAEIDSAERSVAVLQSTIERDSALVRASVRAASRGVEVRVLLSNAWYVAEENRGRVESLNDHAERRDLPLTARIAEPNGRYEKVHAKGVVVDEQTAYVGSLNWNSRAADRNREVVLELRGDVAAGYFAGAFEADWTRSGDRLPVGIAIAALLAACLAAAVARRRVSFGTGKPVAVAGESTESTSETDDA